MLSFVRGFPEKGGEPSRPSAPERIALHQARIGGDGSYRFPDSSLYSRTAFSMRLRIRSASCRAVAR